jgi:hypothetical protein
MQRQAGPQTTGESQVKRDFKGNMRDLNGADILEQTTDDKGNAAKKPISIKTVIVNALLMRKPGEELSGEEQIRRYKLAKRINNATGPTDVDAAEITLIKRQVALHYTPMAVGFIDEILERD